MLRGKREEVQKEKGKRKERREKHTEGGRYIQREKTTWDTMRRGRGEERREIERCTDFLG